ncbi:hypothetical protein Rhein_3194 [Rheinheimera sp. A13L]|uniref:DUF1272 domain-containing protein n=1 Tax=Rheinheimera sp. A13L TaxID=506534 RepID=UPI00021256AD|nr:hypothetical protein Rhein_3194 [Rheinheimera sp. A13L]
MLQLRPNCECCDTNLAPADEAYICSFECTFCPVCTNKMAGICPNCGGELVRRPVRPANKLQANPASAVRTFKAGCVTKTTN